MYEFLLIGPLSILFIVLIYHSFKIDGRRATLKFFLIGFIFAFLRELIIGSTYPLYFGNFRLQLGPIVLSPAIILGWVFSFYLAHYFVRKVTENTPVANHILVKVIIGSFVVLGISLIMETTAPLLEWWSWKEGLIESLPAGSLFLGAPIFVFIGWTITGATFFTIYYLLQEYKITPKLITISAIIFIVIMLNFVIGNYFILYNPPVEYQLFNQQSFQFIMLLFLAIYIKKRHSASIYENILLFILYIFFTIQMLSIIIVFLLNPIVLMVQIVFITISILYQIIIAVQILRIYPKIKDML